eukprot:64472-Alexandrium_andersonii.AAC.1
MHVPVRGCLHQARGQQVGSPAGELRGGGAAGPAVHVVHDEGRAANAHNCARGAAEVLGSTEGCCGGPTAGQTKALRGRDRDAAHRLGGGLRIGAAEEELAAPLVESELGSARQRLRDAVLLQERQLALRDGIGVSPQRSAVDRVQPKMWLLDRRPHHLVELREGGPVGEGGRRCQIGGGPGARTPADRHSALE